jgi:hypothetical protein
METVYIGDTPVIKLRTEETLTGANLLIKYEKPDGTTGHWDSEVDPTDATTMQYMVDSMTGPAGVWILQSYMELDGVVKHGELVEMLVLNPVY